MHPPAESYAGRKPNDKKKETFLIIVPEYATSFETYKRKKKRNRLRVYKGSRAREKKSEKGQRRSVKY